MAIYTERPLPRDIDVEEARLRDQRLTKLQRTWESWDHIVAAYYHYHEPKIGVRRLAKLFGMPNSTVKSIIDRVPRSHPGVKDAAVRFQLLEPVSLRQLPGTVPLRLLVGIMAGEGYPGE